MFSTEIISVFNGDRQGFWRRSYSVLTETNISIEHFLPLVLTGTLKAHVESCWNAGRNLWASLRPSRLGASCQQNRSYLSGRAKGCLPTTLARCDYHGPGGRLEDRRRLLGSSREWGVTSRLVLMENPWCVVIFRGTGKCPRAGEWSWTGAVRCWPR